MNSPQQSELEGYSFTCKVNGVDELIRFSPYRITSMRSEFNISQEYGLDSEGKLSTDFVPFESGSVEALMMDVLRSGEVEQLRDAGLVFYERPPTGSISRNLAVYDPKTGLSYTIGGLGFIAPDANDKTHFLLKDPLLDDTYGAYQKRHGQNVGGTKLVSDDGFKTVANHSVVGAVEYKSGTYQVVRKIQETERMKGLGINAPTFIAAGPILNIADGKYGFTIYRSHLTPEYLLNISLYLDQGANFKKNFEVFLKSKYSQLAHMHRGLGESHGQPSNTNTLCQIKVFEEEDNLSCQIKDFQTNQALPSKRTKTIEDGLCPIASGYIVKKSPYVAAMIYDLQHSLTQELNVLFVPSRFIKDVQQKFNYLTNQSARLLRVVAGSYGIADIKIAQEAIDFAVHRYLELLKHGTPMDKYNEVIAGIFAHKLFELSSEYGEEVEIIKKL